MIAAYTVVAMVCFAIGWRGCKLGDLWRRMRIKLFWLSLVMTLLIFAAFGSLVLALVTFIHAVLIAVLVSGGSFFLGSAGRLLIGAR